MMQASTTLQVAAVLLFVIALLVLRALWVLRSIHRGSIVKRTRTAPLKTLVVLGSGGHTTEMLDLIKNLNPKRYTPLVYVIATTDTTTEIRVQAMGGRLPDSTWRIPRSREVGQSYSSSIATTLYSFLHAIYLVGSVRPGLVLCNGPGTCLPIAVVAFALRVLAVCECEIIFVESFCRVTSLSLTGRLLYNLVDSFVVHWEPLLEKYPRSRLVSTFLPPSNKSTQSS
jgi:beta-1,4-N-acetylglucosaminyltransferase